MRTSVLVLFSILAFGCQEPQARWPVESKGGTFLKVSAERNRRLLEQEEALMDRLTEEDSLHQWITSSSGSRYYYLQQQEGNGAPAQPDDLVTLSYNLLTWAGDTLYTADEIGLIRYKVDKQELFPGLRHSVKLLREGESAVFLFPSSLGYGYHGDDQRIGPNLPLKATLHLLKIEKAKDTIASNP
ncbi:gliding motility-associated peptidyl-prolyl isomerase GldI [Robiginitalea sediminis]|uniref:gliding motility-associated peptidyl-prolyl isomerase GldI n=1 Tax=Robiginitalea sediminis TaxID=1982593 RepID=UPI000B4BFFFD|nr:gliding motility-associated peptidyl-prolyl isomerase GldI [Robiginitalea sediminis]